MSSVTCFSTLLSAKSNVIRDAFSMSVNANLWTLNRIRGAKKQTAAFDAAACSLPGRLPKNSLLHISILDHPIFSVHMDRFFDCYASIPEILFI